MAPASLSRPRAGAGDRPGAGGPRYPGWLALPALAWYALFFLVPLGFVVAYSFGEMSGFSDIAFTWNLDNYRYLWDDCRGFHLYRDVFLATFGLVSSGR